MGNQKSNTVPAHENKQNIQITSYPLIKGEWGNIQSYKSTNHGIKNNQTNKSIFTEKHIYRWNNQADKNQKANKQNKIKRKRDQPNSSLKIILKSHF